MKFKCLLAGYFSLLSMGLNLWAGTFYVNINNPTPVSPYTNWLSAATNIQDAIDAATNGDLVLVTNGVYAAGGRVVVGSITNRVAVTKSLTLQSVNGPALTLIQGNPVLGNSAVRCIYLSNGSALIGFTLTNGATMNAGDYNLDNSGGGLWATNNSTAIVSNCVIVNNISQAQGGGAFWGKLYNCVLSNNLTAGNGGGAAYGTLYGCLVVSNQAITPLPATGGEGGGVYTFELVANCTIIGNIAGQSGGGVAEAQLSSCIVCNNSIYGNGTISYSNYYIIQSAAYCCLSPLPTGSSFGNNFTNDPSFVDYVHGDYHLQSNSPCINSGFGSTAYTPTDLNGNARVVDGFVDIGAYEYQTAGQTLPFLYVQQYNLGLNGAVDSDGDGMSNWQEAIAGTNPTNANSIFKVGSISKGSSGITVGWSCVYPKTYRLFRATNLVNALFVPISTNSPMFSFITSLSFTDRSAATGGPYFYRISVQ